jgi:hypothetical protein
MKAVHWWYCSSLLKAMAALSGSVRKHSVKWCTACAIVLLTGGVGRGDQIAFDDFEGVTLTPFDVANTPTFSDGTDWTNDVPGWTIENDASHVATTSAAYNGWVAMDVNSWSLQQGNQGSSIAPTGRSRMKLGGNVNNTAMVADPDAWDDFPPAGKGNGFNSYFKRTIDITGRDLSSLSLSFDWDFVTEDNQVGVVEVSFDGGTNYAILFAIASKNLVGDPTWGTYAKTEDDLSYSTNPGTDTVELTQRTFMAGTDFTVPPGATSMTVRFGCILSGNDWWFAVDNVELADVNGVIDSEDFEGLTLLPFPDGGVGVPPGDGTDYSQSIANWTIDNDGFWDPLLKMYTRSNERAFDGWAALDSQSWSNQQGGQIRNEFFPNPAIFPPGRNTILVADPDAHDDFDVELPSDHPDKSKKEFNSFIYRVYDVSGYDNTTIEVEMDWESRIESTQRSLVQVSFDCGATWTDLLDVDSDDATKLTELRNAGYLYFDGTGDGIGVNNAGDIFSTANGPQSWQFTNASGARPAKNGSKMILRLGCIDAQNNWWFAVDNIKIEGTPQSFKHGDANQDGVINMSDVTAFNLALSDKANYDGTYAIDADVILDMNADGVFNSGDIAGFECEVSGVIGPATGIVGRSVNHAGYTGTGSSIDTGKTLAQEGLGPTELTMDNLINTTRGINSLVFDIAGLADPGALSAPDFAFQVSPQNVFDELLNPPSGWDPAPAPASVSVTPGSPNRVQIDWADNAIENRWLRVTVLANVNTGLVLPKTYYLGHLRGETTGASGGKFTVLVADILQIRSALAETVDASSNADLDKSGVVLVADILAARGQLAKELTQITVP